MQIKGSSLLSNLLNKHVETFFHKCERMPIKLSLVVWLVRVLNRNTLHYRWLDNYTPWPWFYTWSIKYRSFSRVAIEVSFLYELFAMYIEEFNRDRQEKTLAFPDELCDFMTTLISVIRLYWWKAIYIYIFIYLFEEVATLSGVFNHLAAF